ncbi:MAG TPA: hypothetical protein DCX06_09355 [Opitutae bacterium]|nr:hypothetical protein [Opitutae bacterium]
MAGLILNCDLGENEAAEQTRQFMSLIDAANICCGVHAGSRDKTRETLGMAKEFGVKVGAHPGLFAAGGRGAGLPSIDAFRSLLNVQISSFLELAQELQVDVAYVKLHGSLYSAVEVDEQLLDTYIEVVQQFEPKLGVFGLAGGRCAEKCRSHGLEVWEEAFADRGYNPDGSLVRRSEAGALLNLESAQARFLHWYEHKNLRIKGGVTITLDAQTLCVHSDSPDALALLAYIRSHLR